MKKVDTKKAEVYTIENFLNEDECKILIDKIESRNSRSMVSGGKYKHKAGVTNFRTSSTASLNYRKFPFIEDIDKKISRALGVPIELGETTQGQKYEVGQEFKDHVDYFGKNSLKGHGDKWGNRTWTFMIYLNDDLEGGETDFPKLGIKFKPKKGMAVIWRSLGEGGRPNPNTMHAGRPVKEGVKYVITKWFRQHYAEVYPISPFFRKKYPNLIGPMKKVAPATGKVENSESNLTTKTFSNSNDFPEFTEKGFELRDLPAETWGLIKDTYKLLKGVKRKEKFPGQMKIIYNKDKSESPIDILSLANVKHVKALIHKQLRPILEEWSGQNIIPTMIYGIRSYKDGAILVDHTDRIETHHISCIIIVDEKSNKPWPLDIQDHSGKWHKVYAKPGQMILYESVACKHGRLEEFDGEYFRNFFVHYKLRDWKYVPKSKKRSAISV